VEHHDSASNKKKPNRRNEEQTQTTPRWRNINMLLCERRDERKIPRAGNGTDLKTKTEEKAPTRMGFRTADREESEVKQLVAAATKKGSQERPLVHAAS
jgi:hypothetical protein